MKRELLNADIGSLNERGRPRCAYTELSNRRSAINNHCRAFTLLEIILVLVLIGIAAALLIPSVSAAFSTYQLERAAEDLQIRIAHTRLQAMELGVPYAFTYRAETDQFMTWACEPLSSTGLYAGATSTAAASAVASGDAYDRHFYELNDKPDNREFRFLASSLDEALTAMGLDYEARTLMAVTTSAESVAGSSVLSQQKLGLVAASSRSVASLQIPGLQLGDVMEPIVFEPDGSADRDAIIRVADRSNRYVEITLHSLTGAITSSGTLTVENLVTTAAQPRKGVIVPTRSREVRQGSGGAQ
jgi:prepilin-type N-terminal cleavage/methylation domain-containing protein